MLIQFRVGLLPLFAIVTRPFEVVIVFTAGSRYEARPSSGKDAGVKRGVPGKGGIVKRKGAGPPRQLPCRVPENGRKNNRGVDGA